MAGCPRRSAGYAAGTPYRADDPQLLLWILYTLIDSSIVVYRTYVGRLRAREQESLWEDYKVVGRLFGLRRAQMPDTFADLSRYGRDMLEGDDAGGG